MITNKDLFTKIMMTLDKIIDGYIYNTDKLDKPVPQYILNKMDREINEITKQPYYQKFLLRLKNQYAAVLKKNYIKYYRKERDKLVLTPLQIKDLDKTVLRELERRQKMCFDLIKDKQQKNIDEIKRRILGWSTEIQTKTKGDEFAKGFKESIDMPKISTEFTKHEAFILRDQNAKMLSNIDYITHTKEGAIGFFWKTREDKRVVGNPTGLYPKGNAMHNNHYIREGKFFMIRDNWAQKQGLVKKISDVMYVDEIPDGIPANGINCRCVAMYVLEVEDVPTEILTNKGREYVA